MSRVFSCLLLLASGFLVSGCAVPAPGGAAGASVDLTRQSWFPPVRAQAHFSCSQQAAIYYLLTSEWNRTAGRRADSAARRLSPYYPYAILAGGETGRSHVVDGWIVARETGVPPEADFPGNSRVLMHGYDRYLRAMACRAEDWEVIPLTAADGIDRARRLLAAGHPLVCDFQVRDCRHGRLAPGLPHAGEFMVERWGRTGPGHAMVYAGYDDAVGFDYNGDGAITNDRDITGDGAVTLADRERGAFLLVNPWGPGWGDRGRAWVGYREHAVNAWPWSHAVAAVRAAPPRVPRLTLKLRLFAAERRDVIVRAVAGRRLIEPWLFSHQPSATRDSGSLWESVSALRGEGPHLSAGPLAAPGGGPLETGHDLTAVGKASRYVLSVLPAAGVRLQGRIESASFLEYDSFGRLVREVPVEGLPAVLPSGGGTWETR